MKSFKLLLLSALVGMQTQATFAVSEQRQQILENTSGHAQPQSGNFYDRRSEGWFWYEDPELKKKKLLEEQQRQQQQQQPPKQQPPKQVDIVNPNTGVVNEPIVIQAAPSKPKALSVEWLKQQMPVALQSALDNPLDSNGRPTKEVETYMYMQRLALDKSQNFSKAAKTVTETNPFLDENSRIPMDTASNRVFVAAHDNDKKEALKYLSQRTGLWFFYDVSCSFCSSQYEFLKDFKIENNFKVQNISMDGRKLPKMTASDIVLPDRGQAVNLKLKITPSIVLLAPPNNFYVVSQGLITPSSLESKILLIAEQQNLLPKYLKDKLNPYAKGVLTPQQMKQMQQVESDLNEDPTKLVDLMNKVAGYD
ncbi:conjugal transfer protein TraF [Acinetobacter sp. ANC 5380]|uniref:Conjugal transfer protein TraF n=1 Tax=Acinetobacter terrae TaxID=2731247 RepID=A0A7Y2RI61_9GAMM|nr:conjugal transfer protein TraF [Acinetobacter terrae]NNH79195.1 conjugal transfer protein TraF [Acinetobacter terrae]